MKAITLRKPGGLDKLEFGDIDEPRAPGAGEVTVRIRASSLNYHDYLVVTGQSPGTADGLIPLTDGAGEVVAVGPGKRDDNGKLIAMDLKVGDRILFGKYSGQVVKVEGEELLVMREEDVMGVIA